MFLYLDLCCLHRPFDDPSQPRVAAEASAVLRVLTHIESGGATLASSAALFAEAAQGRHPVRRAYAEHVMAAAAVTIPATVAAVRAAELEAAVLAPMDALHLASAEAAGADYFCTCDDRFLRRARAVAIPPLRAVSPIELVAELGL